MAKLKTVTVPRDYEGLHIEIPGAIINVRVGLHDQYGREITAIEILKDDYAGELPWLMDTGEGEKVSQKSAHIRLIHGDRCPRCREGILNYREQCPECPYDGRAVPVKESEH